MTETKKCVFCEYNKDRVLEETALSVALCNDDAIKPGHIVLAVKEHVDSFSKLSAEQAADIFALAARAAAVGEQLCGAKKYYVVAIADMVRHFHIHLLPKMPGEPPIGHHVMGDDGWKGEVRNPVSQEEIEGFVRKFRELRLKP